MSEVTIADHQWELLMEVLWAINNGIAELNKNLTAETVSDAPSVTLEHIATGFTPAQAQMLRDFIENEKFSRKR